MAGRSRTSAARKLQVADEDFAENLGHVKDFAADLPEKYLHCRELGHLWRPWKAGVHPDGGYERTLRCSRCGTKREQSLSSMGMVLSNNYKHPDGYLSPEGVGRIVGEGRGLLRLESIKRVIAKNEE